MKTLRLLVLVLIASTIVWMVYWKLSGQDLNLFARSVLPVPILGTFVLSSLFSGIIAGIYRLIKGRWFQAYPRILWASWVVTLIGFIALVRFAGG